MSKPCRLFVTTNNVRVKSTVNLSYCRSNNDKLEYSSVQEMYTHFPRKIWLLLKFAFFLERKFIEMIDFYAYPCELYVISTQNYDFQYICLSLESIILFISLHLI